MRIVLLILTLLVNLIADITIEQVHKNLALSIDVERKKLPQSVTKSLIIKDNGIKSVIEIPLNKKLRSSVASKKEGILVDFSDDFLDTQKFADEFNISLKEKLSIGYYIFENSSNLNDEKLIEEILLSNYQKNIKTIRPNWKMGVVGF